MSFQKKDLDRRRFMSVDFFGRKVDIDASHGPDSVFIGDERAGDGWSGFLTEIEEDGDVEEERRRWRRSKNGRG